MPVLYGGYTKEEILSRVDHTLFAAGRGLAADPARGRRRDRKWNGVGLHSAVLCTARLGICGRQRENLYGRRFPKRIQYQIRQGFRDQRRD